MGYPGASAVMVTAWPGANPSTVVPKTICDFGVSLICIRGSAEGSVESRSNTRPSSALEETFDGKLTEIWARRGVKARNPATRKKKLRRIRPAYTSKVLARACSTPCTLRLTKTALRSLGRYVLRY